MNEESFALELQNTFLAEACEMLEDTETAFMQVEANPSDAAKIDKIFRLVHTIKGSAHVAGFAELGAFAHTFETLIGALREKKLAVTPDVVDVLLAGNDCLKQVVDALTENKSATVDASETERRIKACLPGDPTPKASRHLQSAPQVAVAPSPKQVPQPSTAPLDSPERPVFLICDDEPNILSLLEECLVEGGYRVISVGSTKKALEIFRNQHIDVIFTDLRMPDMNGIEFVSAVRALNEFVPIAFVSGHSSRENFKDYLKLGVDAFIEKPFTTEEVLSVASRTVREKNLREAVLALSRLSFKVYVSIEKILSLTPPTEAMLGEKVRLDTCMQDIRNATAKLLASERALKR